MVLRFGLGLKVKKDVNRIGIEEFKEKVWIMAEWQRNN